MLVRRFAVVALLCVGAGAAGFAALGESLTLGLLTIVERWVLMGFAPLAYVASAIGVGIPLARVVCPGTNSWTLRAGLGLAATLTITHVLGSLGAIQGAAGPFVAWAALVPGLVLLAIALRSGLQALTQGDTLLHRLDVTLASRWAGPGAVAMGVLLAAACMPPGILWRSEFGGFDSLSYHLQLPKEWMLAGRVSTVSHNVYSGLPSYLESAFFHVGWLQFPSLTGATPGLLDADGASLIAAQQLHALLCVLACLATARVAREVATRVGSDETTSRVVAAVVFSLLLLTPWTLVTGSLSYNEQGVALFTACAGLALLLPMPPTRRFLTLALLIGAAVGVKPTAILFVGVPAGILALGMLWRECSHATSTRRDATKAIAIGLLAGVCMLAPWMIRNATATRNPVFPFAASVFSQGAGGTGWWSEEQVARFKQSHTFTGSVSERVKLAFVPDMHDPVRPSWRGVTNPQWGLLLLAGALAAATCVVLAKRNASTTVVPLALIVTLCVQAAMWLFATHIQSRFLLPLALPAALALGLLIALIRHVPIRVLVMFALITTQGLFFVRALLIESDRGPASGLLALPSDFMGVPANPRLSREDLSPVAFVNRELPADAKVLLLGDATPLYFARPVLYATTYDTSPLFTLANVDAANTATWSPALKAVGVTHVLVNLGELDRYRRSGFLDPRLEMGRVQTWAQGLGPPIAVWPGGVALFAVR